jgi:hypothetical protein
VKSILQFDSAQHHPRETSASLAYVYKYFKELREDKHTCSNVVHPTRPSRVLIDLLIKKEKIMIDQSNNQSRFYRSVINNPPALQSIKDS